MSPSMLTVHLALAFQSCPFQWSPGQHLAVLGSSSSSHIFNFFFTRSSCIAYEGELNTLKKKIYNSVPPITDAKSSSSHGQTKSLRMGPHSLHCPHTPSPLQVAQLPPPILFCSLRLSLHFARPPPSPLATGTSCEPQNRLCSPPFDASVPRAHFLLCPPGEQHLFQNVL